MKETFEAIPGETNDLNEIIDDLREENEELRAAVENHTVRICGIPQDRLEMMLKDWKRSLEEMDEFAEDEDVVGIDEPLDGLTQFETNMLSTLRRWMD